MFNNIQNIYLGFLFQVENFCGIVSGFVNASCVVEKFGNKEKITSNSLRSLCKTVLNDTNPTTASASDRSKVVINILAAILPGETSGSVNASKLSEIATLVDTEEDELRQLKGMLGTQGTLRPIFEGQLRQRRSVRERAMSLRKLVAESGLDYKAVSDLYKASSVVEEEDVSAKLKPVLKEKLLSNATDADVDELIVLFDAHFRPPQQPPIVTNGNHDEAKVAAEGDVKQGSESDQTTTTAASIKTENWYFVSAKKSQICYFSNVKLMVNFYAYSFRNFFLFKIHLIDSFNRFSRTP